MSHVEHDDDDDDETKTLPQDKVESNTHALPFVKKNAKQVQCPFERSESKHSSLVNPSEVCAPQPILSDADRLQNLPSYKQSCREWKKRFSQHTICCQRSVWPDDYDVQHIQPSPHMEQMISSIDSTVCPRIVVQQLASLIDCTLWKNAPRTTDTKTQCPLLINFTNPILPGAGCFGTNTPPKILHMDDPDELELIWHSNVFWSIRPDHPQLRHTYPFRPREGLLNPRIIVYDSIITSASPEQNIQCTSRRLSVLHIPLDGTITAPTVMKKALADSMSLLSTAVIQGGYTSLFFSVGRWMRGGFQELDVAHGLMKTLQSLIQRHFLDDVEILIPAGISKSEKSRSDRWKHHLLTTMRSCVAK